MRTFFNPVDKENILSRLRSLNPNGAYPLGGMTVCETVDHLIDGMRGSLGDIICNPKPSILQVPQMRHALIYWVPWNEVLFLQHIFLGWIQWTKGIRKESPEIDLAETELNNPSEWESNLALLISLIERFSKCDENGEWPPNDPFGSITGRDWGVFLYKEFDNHLRQLGV